MPSDWCSRDFTKRPSFNFVGLDNAINVFLKHIQSSEKGGKEKFQIVVDSDLDGICSSTIVYKFLYEFYPEVETVFSLHSGKQHGLSKDIKIENDTTLVICPDAASNDIEQCNTLYERGVDVICLDHHIIERPNPHAAIVSCMDGVYPNQNLCGTAVTWLFLSALSTKDRMDCMLENWLDLVAVATISDVMQVTNEDNMFFIQNGLKNINSRVLRTFLQQNEVPLNNVTIEHIKFKVSPLISAMIRMGSAEEKNLLFRAFIDDYEEFDYEKRGSFDVVVENIYERAVRLCKNAKSRQDRAKKKLLDECEIHEYPCIILVEYSADKPSTLTGLVANEIANEYCKPCIVYRASSANSEPNDENTEYTGSIRNYDGSPIFSLKAALEFAFDGAYSVQGHDNAAGIIFNNISPDEFADKFETALFSSGWEAETDIPDVAIGEKLYEVDFEVDAENIDIGFVRIMSEFDNYSGFGFPQVTALVKGIKVSQENFKTMGKNTFNWKILDDDANVSYVKFRVDRERDELIQKFDDLDFGFTSYSDTCYILNAICSFGLNVYNGEIYAQGIIKDYEITGEYKKEVDFDDDIDLEF